MSELKTKRLQCNLLQQNVYVRDISLPFDEQNDYRVDKFVSMDFVDEPGVSREVVTEHDYPITPDSVNSYADSCNYKLDPLGSQSRGSFGLNLGDVTFMQKLMSMDSSERNSYLSDLRSRLSSAQATPVQTAPAQVTPAQVVSVSSENKL